MPSSTQKTDYLVVSIILAVIGALSLYLQHEINTRQALLFLVGGGLGVSLYHAMFGFSGSWRAFIRERQSVTIRAQLALFILTSLLFIPVFGQVFDSWTPAGAVSPAGFSVLMGAFLFGIGMQLGGGCGSGTLFTVGGGHVNMLVTLLFFIVGALLGSIHLEWWLALPSLGKVSLIRNFGWLPTLILQLIVLIVLIVIVSSMDKSRNGTLKPLTAFSTKPFIERLIFGPWPVSWGVVGLFVFSVLTLILANHLWSITFAFGLWGAKIWTALGGDLSAVAYWSSGYPAKALNRSVLADVTSVMNFGIVLGAVLAASLAGRFAPSKSINKQLLIFSIIGGLLLGYGARLAFGCNIGGLFAGISSGSLHGWLWLLAGFTGNIVGVYIRVWLGMDKPFSKRAV